MQDVERRHVTLVIVRRLARLHRPVIADEVEEGRHRQAQDARELHVEQSRGDGDEMAVNLLRPGDARDNAGGLGVLVDQTTMRFRIKHLPRTRR